MNANTFEAHNQTWFRHSEDKATHPAHGCLITIIFDDGETFNHVVGGGRSFRQGERPIGWRFAEAETSAPEPEACGPAFEYVHAEALGCSSDAIKAKGLAILGGAGVRIYEDVAGFGYAIEIDRAENDEAPDQFHEFAWLNFLQAVAHDVPAMKDESLPPRQRRIVNEMEEKQSAKERLQHDAKTKALQERVDSLNEAGRAMERVKQDHGHRLGYFS